MDTLVDTLGNFASLLSAMAALGALWYARDTVRETRELRREERLARLPELVADLVKAALETREDALAVPGYRIANLRLEATLAASGESLPRCEALAKTDLVSGISLVALAEAAFDELADQMRGAR